MYLCVCSIALLCKSVYRFVYENMCVHLWMNVWMVDSQANLATEWQWKLCDFGKNCEMLPSCRYIMEECVRGSQTRVQMPHNKAAFVIISSVETRGSYHNQVTADCSGCSCCSRCRNFQLTIRWSMETDNSLSLSRSLAPSWEWKHMKHLKVVTYAGWIQ